MLTDIGIYPSVSFDAKRLECRENINSWTHLIWIPLGVGLNSIVRLSAKVKHCGYEVGETELFDPRVNFNPQIHIRRSLIQSHNTEAVLTIVISPL